MKGIFVLRNLVVSFKIVPPSVCGHRKTHSLDYGPRNRENTYNENQVLSQSYSCTTKKLLM